MDFEQISGTSDLYNKADNIITVIREYKEENIDQGINGTIAVLKNRYFKDLPRVNTHYDEETGLLLEISDRDEIVGYSFAWDSEPLQEGFQAILNDRDCPF